MNRYDIRAERRHGRIRDLALILASIGALMIASGLISMVR